MEKYQANLPIKIFSSELKEDNGRFIYFISHNELVNLFTNVFQ